MKSLLKMTAATLLATASVAYAGAIERTGQSVELLFEDGNVAEFSFAYVIPNVREGATGTEMAPDYSLVSGGFKMDYGSISAALLFDQPFGALVEYTSPAPLDGINADLRTNAITALIGYDVTPNIMVYGGVTAQTTSATVSPNPATDIVVSSATGWGFVAGAAYQIPEIAMRVSLTYRSEITSEHPTDISVLPGGVPDSIFVTPQALILEAQTGINEKTLVFGSIRWANWSGIAIIAGQTVPLVAYTHDVISYEIGVGRKLTSDLSGALSIGYEASDGEPASILSPTDGRLSVGAALIYTMGNTELTGGIRYTMLGDAVASGIPFTDNTALAAGISIKHSF